MEPRKENGADADRLLTREGTSRRGLWRLRRRICRGRRTEHVGKWTHDGTGKAHRGLTSVGSSASEARPPSGRDGSMGGGSARRTEEAGESPPRGRDAQGGDFGGSDTPPTDADN